MKKTLIALGASLCLASVAMAAEPGAAAVVVKDTATPGKAAVARVVQVSATVTAIDAATRHLTLKTASGEEMELAVGEEVKNFPQIKVGDSVNARVTQALALQVKKGPGVREQGNVVASAVAKPGQKPAGKIAQQVTVMADVVAVDEAKKTISLKGPKGNTVVLDVNNPEHFKAVKVGDQVEVVYTEAMALWVEAAPKK